MAFSDRHIQDLETPVLATPLAKLNVVIYSGDNEARFGPSKNAGQNIFAEIAEHSKHGVFAIVGNDDLSVATDEAGNMPEHPLLKSPKKY
jgi:Icc-related predicted phosphoesterase